MVEQRTFKTPYTEPTRTDHYQDTGNPDLGYHYSSHLDSDTYHISVSKQSRVQMLFFAGGDNAFVQYLIACGVSGSKPGTLIKGLEIPINVDIFTLGSLWMYGSPMFTDFPATSTRTEQRGRCSILSDHSIPL